MPAEVQATENLTNDLESSLPISPPCPRSSLDNIFSQSSLGVFLVLASAFVFSIMTLFVDAAGQQGIPSFEMMIVRCIFQFITSGIICLVIGINPFGTSGNRTLPLLRGIFGPLSTSALFYGATQIPIADATVLKFTSPIWTVLIARVVLKESITAANLVCICLGFLGVVCVAQPDFLLELIDSGVQESPGGEMIDSWNYYTTVLICLAGAVCSSCVYVIIRKSGGSVHFQVLVFYYGLVGIFSSTVLLLVFQGYPVIPSDWTGYADMVVISISGCVAQTMFNKGAQLIDATRTAVFRSTDVIFVLFWQVTLLHEMPTLWSLIGMCLICSCTIVMAFTKKKKKDDIPQQVEPSAIEMETLIVDGEANQN